MAPISPGAPSTLTTSRQPHPYGTYLKDPAGPLFDRSYSAVGFFALAQKADVNVLAQMPSVITAASSRKAYENAVGDAAQSVLIDWAASYYRDPSRGSDWDVTGPCEPSAGVRVEPTPAEPDTSSTTPSYTVAPYDLEVSQAKDDIVHITGSGDGNVRGGDVMSMTRM